MSTVSTASHRKYSARAFVRGGMTCPHCRREMRQPAEACPRCGFDLVRCEKSFPFKAPPLTLLVDPSGLLPEGVLGEIERPYGRFRKRFPQIDFSFCVVKLHPDLNIRDFAFWLHNSAPSADFQRAWILLVVCDLATDRLSLSSGFALEPFLRDDPLEASLRELAACISENSWAEGISGFIRDFSQFLEHAWSTANERRRHIDSRASKRAKSTP